MSRFKALTDLPRSVARSFIVFTLTLCCVGVTHAEDVLRTGDLTEAETAFARKVIFDYGWTDVARTWIEARQKSRPSRTGRGDLEYFIADCLRVEGDLESMNTMLEELRAKYPDHPRSRSVGLQLIQSALAGVLGDMLDAQLGEASERASLLVAAQQAFNRDVMEPVNQSIDALNKEVAKIEDGDYSKKGAERDQWEHFRIRAYKLYAERLPEDGADARKAYEKMLEYATSFCDERFANQLYVYEGQLFRAIALAAVDQKEEAADIMELLAEVEPDAPPPYPEPVVNFVRELRLRGMTNYARTFNAAGQSDKVVALFDRVIQFPSKDFPYKADPETPEIEPFRVQAEIEEAIARTAGGTSPAAGAAIFNTLIARFTDAKYIEANPKRAGEYMVEVGRGISRLIDARVGGLRPELYYRAGIGYKSRGRYSDALHVFKLCLQAGGDAKDGLEWAQKASYEIAETHAILGRKLEAAVCYLAHVERFGPALGKKTYNAATAAQNAFAYFGQLAGDTAGEDAYDELEAIGNVLFEEYGSGVAAERSKMQNAFEAEQRGEYANARKLYASVKRTTKDEGREVDVPIYYDAQAAAARCLYQESQAKADKLGESNAARELESIAIDAKARGSQSGRAAALYELAIIHWSNGEGDADKVAATLAPFERELNAKTDARRAGLYLWIQALVKKIAVDDAARIFGVLSADFAAHSNVAQAAMFMVDAHRQRGTEADLVKAAEYVQTYLAHPLITLDEQPVAFLGELAEILLQGKKFTKALELLGEAQKRVDETEDDGLKLIIRFRFAQASAAEGKHQDAIDALEQLIVDFPEVAAGGVDEAPGIYSALGHAYLALYEQTPTAKLLESARKAFESGTAILQGRWTSYRANGKSVPPKIDLAFWQSYLQLLKVYLAQDQSDYVSGTIKDFRLRFGGKAFAPGVLQQEFDQLEATAKSKK